jgi:hypothetical protein
MKTWLIILVVPLFPSLGKMRVVPPAANEIAALAQIPEEKSFIIKLSHLLCAAIWILAGTIG